MTENNDIAPHQRLRPNRNDRLHDPPAVAVRRKGDPPSRPTDCAHPTTATTNVIRKGRGCAMAKPCQRRVHVADADAFT
jgi:hypothetical protein